MSRSQRYIPPSDEDLERLRKSHEAAEQFDRVRLDLLRSALTRIKKADLVELILRISREEKTSEWMLENEIALDKPINLLVHDVEDAINTATRVDELRLNCNFDYDWRAYEAVRRGLSRLIHKNAIKESKSLALKLMDQGSYQIECSDEGLMQKDIERCLRPVIAAVAESSGGREWALKMLRHDRMRFVCEHELSELAGLKTPANRRGSE